MYSGADRSMRPRFRLDIPRKTAPLSAWGGVACGPSNTPSQTSPFPTVRHSPAIGHLLQDGADDPVELGRLLHLGLELGGQPRQLLLERLAVVVRPRAADVPARGQGVLVTPNLLHR